MHPHTFFSTLYDHTKRDEVFVIKSFHPDFDARWTHVIEPAIREDLKLKPHLVLDDKSGESIVHDIIDGIAHAKLVLADITSINMSDHHSKVYPQRNGNVMWELGIAHTMRMPDEVIMVKSDDERSIFDLTQFRAFYYDPTIVPAARKRLLDLMQDRLKSIDQTKSDYVRRCANSLDPASIGYLMNVSMDSVFDVKPTMGNAVTVTRLFELGIFKAAEFKFDGEKFVTQYVVSPLGRDVARFLVTQHEFVIDGKSFTVDTDTVDAAMEQVKELKSKGMDPMTTGKSEKDTSRDA